MAVGCHHWGPRCRRPSWAGRLPMGAPVVVQAMPMGMAGGDAYGNELGAPPIVQATVVQAMPMGVVPVGGDGGGPTWVPAVVHAMPVASV